MRSNRKSDILSDIAAGAAIGAIGLLGCAGILLIVALFIALGALFWGSIVYLVWNFGIAAAFSLPSITFWWQSVAIGLGFSLLLRAISGATSK